MPLFRKTYHSYTDEALVGLLQKGKEAAFEELYARYADKMYRFFYKMLYQDKEIAEDFCQMLFLKVFEKSETIDSNKPFGIWLYSVAANLCRNEYRRKSRSSRVIQFEQRNLSVPASAPGNIDKEQFNNQLQGAINNLEEKYRLCFVLRYQEEKTIPEISELLGCPQGTVKSRLHYTLKKLAKQLGQFNPTQQQLYHE